MHVKSALVLPLIISMSLISPSMAADGANEDGQFLAFDRNKGNCLACHAIPKDSKAKSPGDIGPPLLEMKARFPDRAKLRAQIWDATVLNPKTAMPPFGRNKILTDQEIDLVTDYILGM